MAQLVGYAVMKLRDMAATGEVYMAGPLMLRVWRGITDLDQPAYAFVSVVALAGEPSDIPGLVRVPSPTKQAALSWAADVAQPLEEAA